MLRVTSTLSPGGALEPEKADGRSRPEQAGGFVLVALWICLGVFGLGALLVVPALIIGGAALYVALFGALAIGGAVLGLVIADVMSLIDRIRHPHGPRARTILTAVVFVLAIGLLAPWTIERLGWARIPFDASWPAIAGATGTFLAAMLSTGPAERRAALVLAAGWVLLLSCVGYRVWTEMDAYVVHLGSVYGQGDQIAFEATRSADYEVRFGAPTCVEGLPIASGRYEFVVDDPHSSLGRPVWVALPRHVLPLKSGDLVRVCLRDGLATATAAGEFGGGIGGPSSFWPRP